MSVVSDVCCEVEVSATGWSLVQRSPTECGVSDCDRVASTMRRPWPTGGAVVPRKTQVTMGLDSLVGIAAGHWLDGRSSNASGLGDFPHPSTTTRGPSQPPVNRVPGLFPRGKAAGAWRWPHDSSTAKVLNTSTPLQGLRGHFYGESLLPFTLLTTAIITLILLSYILNTLHYHTLNLDMTYFIVWSHSVESNMQAGSAVVPGPISWKSRQ